MRTPEDPDPTATNGKRAVRRRRRRRRRRRPRIWAAALRLLMAATWTRRPRQQCASRAADQNFAVLSADAVSGAARCSWLQPGRGGNPSGTPRARLVVFHPESFLTAPGSERRKRRIMKNLGLESLAMQSNLWGPTFLAVSHAACLGNSGLRKTKKNVRRRRRRSAGGAPSRTAWTRAAAAVASDVHASPWLGRKPQVAGYFLCKERSSSGAQAAARRRRRRCVAVAAPSSSPHLRAAPTAQAVR